MIAYWFLLLIAYLNRFIGGETHTPPGVKLNRPLAIVAAIIAVAIGIRHEVGGDWISYEQIYARARWLSFWEVLYRAARDPAFSLLNWFSQRLDGGVYLVNFATGSILCYGIYRFAMEQRRPWLVMFVSVPYLIIVIGMGYVRQSAAIGLELLALNYLAANKPNRFVGWILAGALFHKSVVLALPLAAFVSTRNKWIRFAWVGVTGAVAAKFLIGDDAAEHLWHHYVERGRDSSGALIRVLMNAISGVAFLWHRQTVSKTEMESKAYYCLAIASIACIPLTFLASTATDRMALYIIPLQLYVAGNIPNHLAKTFVPLVVMYYVAVQFVWLNFASHAHYWVPYSTMFSVEGTW